jgi:hypothetical protein
MGLNGTAKPRAGQRRGPGMPLGLPAHAHSSELNSLVGHECADRVAHLRTLTFAGEVPGSEW